MAGYFAASDEVGARMRARGIAAERVHVTGIPIVPAFAEPHDRAACAAAFGLDAQRPTLLLMGGGAGLGGLDLEALGIPPIEAIAKRYSERSGVPVEGKLDWYFAYNLFRLAGIVQGIKKRLIDGTASHANAAEIAAKVPILAKAAWGFAEHA
jgi:hypothetical protein